MKNTDTTSSKNVTRKWFKVKLGIGIAGYVQADYYEITDTMVVFYTQPEKQQVATYSIASVFSVEEILNDTTSKVLLKFDPPEAPTRKAS